MCGREFSLWIDLGECYYYGNGVEQDYGKSLEYDEKSGSLGNVTGMKNAALIYRYADYGRQD